MHNNIDDLFGPDFDPLPGAVILHESVAAYDLAPPKIRIIDSTVDNIGFSFKQPDGQTRIEFVISESKLIEPTAKDEFDIWKYTSSAALVARHGYAFAPAIAFENPNHQQFAVSLIHHSLNSIILESMFKKHPDGQALFDKCTKIFFKEINSKGKTQNPLVNILQRNQSIRAYSRTNKGSKYVMKDLLQQDLLLNQSYYLQRVNAHLVSDPFNNISLYTLTDMVADTLNILVFYSELQRDHSLKNLRVEQGLYWMD